MCKLTNAHCKFDRRFGCNTDILLLIAIMVAVVCTISHRFGGFVYIPRRFWLGAPELSVGGETWASRMWSPGRFSFSVSVSATFCTLSSCLPLLFSLFLIDFLAFFCSFFILRAITRWDFCWKNRENQQYGRTRSFPFLLKKRNKWRKEGQKGRKEKHSLV